MKAKTVKGNWSLRTKKVELSCVFLCIFFFLAGYFGSSFIDHSQEDEYDLRLMQRSRGKLLEKSKEETEHRLLNVGESGDNFITSIPYQILSLKPRALYFPNFASAEQCETIIEIATKKGLTPSAVNLPPGVPQESTRSIRSSSGAFYSVFDDKTGVLDAIEEKISKATQIPRNHGEDFNILRYKVGQKYNSHYDAFNYGKFDPRNSQRMASFLLYLTDVEEGGETMFPFENGLNMDGSYGYAECIGLRVKPRKGDGLLFYSLFPNGTVDRTSLHGSCPVIKGDKWVATKWLRNQELEDYLTGTSN
ncbi:probable prolyl 4-hydroxylase 9 [Cicer arietinum]|uniref:procollagen-proline 4-dioxygenase n=2 Tax=Magnoliopsida TaxID=3398 RepID=A0A1S2YYB5_CICAR|nr:probable prolyl 4-hydroxylase 9 [Cicer arietinum]